MPLRVLTYVIILGGILFLIILGTYASFGSDYSVAEGFFAALFLLIVLIVNSVALSRSSSKGLCATNYILIVLFSVLLTAGWCGKRSAAWKHSQEQKIFLLERELKKQESPDLFSH